MLPRTTGETPRRNGPDTLVEAVTKRAENRQFSAESRGPQTGDISIFTDEKQGNLGPMAPSTRKVGNNG